MAAPSTRNIIPLLPTGGAVATTRRYTLTVLGVGLIPVRWLLSLFPR